MKNTTFVLLTSMLTMNVSASVLADPVTNDYDGDGRFDPALWRPSDGRFYVYPSSRKCPAYMVQHGPGCEVQWGLPGDIALTGDYDGDRRSDPVVWRQTSGILYVLPSSGDCPPSMTPHYNGCETQWGLPGDQPISGDFDRDNRSDAAVWRPSDGSFYVVPSSGHCTSRMEPFAHGCRVQWGLGGDVPVVGDYDNDRYADPAVWRPINATYYVLPSSNDCFRRMLPHGHGCELQYGEYNEIPIVGRFDRSDLFNFGTHDPFRFAFKYLPEAEPWYGFPEDFEWIDEGINPGATIIPSDTDNDGVDDVVQVRSEGGLLYFFYHDEQGHRAIQWGLESDMVLTPLTDYFPI